MKKQQVRDLIYDGLKSVLSPKSFKLRKSEEGFVRPVADGKQTIGVPLYDYNPQFEFEVTACVRLNSVEALFHLFSGSPPQYQQASYSTTTLLNYFLPTGDGLQFKVSNEQDILNSLDQLSVILRNRIVPFLDEHQDVKSLNRGMNHDAKSSDSSQHPWRAMHAIILAHLAQDPGFGHIVTRYETDVQTLPHPYQEMFNRLVEYLKSIR